MAHFLLGYWEIERDLLMLLDMCRTVWDREWLDEFWQEDEEGKMALLLDKGVEGICNRVMKDMESAYCIGWVDGGSGVEKGWRTYVTE